MTTTPTSDDVFFPSEGDRIVVTTITPDGGKYVNVGVATRIMPFHKAPEGAWIGGWTFTGTNYKGQSICIAMACTRSMRLHHPEYTQIVRLATDDD